MDNLPRHIDSSLIDVGDRIKIELPKNQGVIHTLEGIVHRIESSGGVTYYFTKEGANILARHPGSSPGRVLLISRETKKPAKLFSDKFWQSNNDDVFAETKERLA
jgi:hypothetical protein